MLEYIIVLVVAIIGGIALFMIKSIPSLAGTMKHGGNYRGKQQKPDDDYPYCELWKTADNARQAMKNLAAYEFTLAEIPFTVPLVGELTPMDLNNSLASLKKPLVAVLSDDSHDELSWLSDYFNERCRVRGKLYREPLSPWDYWQKHKKTVRNLAGTKYGAETPQNCAKILYDSVYGCTSFRPELLVATIKMLGSRSVLDISSGWGDRLLAAMCMKVRYVGVDPNECLQDGYARMKSMFADDDGGANKYSTIVGKFQDVELPDELFDLVFSSPPYFSVEEYSQDDSQSIREFSDVDSWWSGFLRPSLQKAWNRLRAGGYMVLHINNTPRQPDYVLRMRDFVATLPNATYLGLMGKIHDTAARITAATNKIPAARPIWMWRKESSDSMAIADRSPPLPQVPRIVTIPAASIILEKLAEVHVAELSQHVTEDPRVMRTVANGKTWNAARLRQLIQWDDDARYRHRAIIVDNVVVGYIGTYPLESTHRGENSRDVQFRILIGRKWQSLGIGSRALLLLCRELRDAGVERLYKHANPRNIASVKQGQDIGFRPIPGNWAIHGKQMIRQVIDLAQIK